MKKNYQSKYFNTKRNRILFLLIFMFFTVNSCKKDIKTENGNKVLSAKSAFAGLSEQARIKPQEISRWLQNLPEAFRADVQLNNARIKCDQRKAGDTHSYC